MEELTVSEPTPPVVPEPPRPVEPRRLRRSRRDRIVGGVCGGFARYLGVDPVLLRIVTVALVLSGGAGLLAYVVAWVVIPDAESDEPEGSTPSVDGHTTAIVVGAALLGLGVLLLLRQWMPMFGMGMFWPRVIVAAGVLILVSARR
jgi:phage shock protein C